jgi:hypothetical protein
MFSMMTPLDTVAVFMTASRCRMVCDTSPFSVGGSEGLTSRDTSSSAATRKILRGT